MVRQADIVVAYVLYDWSGASKTLNYASKFEKQTINLANM